MAILTRLLAAYDCFENTRTETYGTGFHISRQRWEAIFYHDGASAKQWFYFAWKWETDHNGEKYQEILDYDRCKTVLLKRLKG